MFKKFMSIVMVLVVSIVCAVSVSAACVSEDGRPDIIGVEHFDKVMELNDAYYDGEFELVYETRMVHIEGYWFVYLEGKDGMENYAALGIYTEMPTEEDIDILWTNRMTCDELSVRMEELGY